MKPNKKLNFLNSEILNPEIIKYWYERYIFTISEDMYVKMAVLSKTEYELDQDRELTQKYKTVSSYSEELPIELMPKEYKTKIDKNGKIEEQFELNKELFETYAKLQGKELLELNTKLIK
ncbi:hypothetical protein [Oceanobacillus luteolus]|uniref:Uncharacterized protein n=1 Tax=Oceanobacillus luteolus TaxID=1274358 RepID=A0ABW4HY96_9BACI